MTGKAKGRKAAKAPVRRKSKVKAGPKQRPERSLKPLLIKGWWVLRGALAGAAMVAIAYGVWQGAEVVVKLPSLSVKTIKVAGCSDVQMENVLELSGVRKGVPLLKVNLEEVRRRIVRHPSIKEVVVVRRLPDTLIIEIRERKGVAVIVGPEGYAMVDDEGVVITASSRYTADYPLVSGPGLWADPGEISDRALPAVRTITALASSGLVGADRISEAWTDKGVVHVSLVETGTLLIMSSKNIRSDIKRLGRLMESSLFDVQAAGYDLRFFGRVVRLPERTGQGA